MHHTQLLTTMSDISYALDTPQVTSTKLKTVITQQRAKLKLYLVTYKPSRINRNETAFLSYSPRFHHLRPGVLAFRHNTQIANQQK